MTNDDLLHKWIEGTLTPEEQQLFESRPEYPSIRALYAQTANWQAPDFDQAAMLSKILAQDNSPSNVSTASDKPEARVRRLNWTAWAVAATALLLVGIIFWLNRPQPVALMAAVGEQVRGTLPDASSFTLNADSDLQYDPSSWETSRLVNLQGEAYFEVAKGATFTVATEQGAVQVLGTRFNVRARSEGLSVSCQEGRVSVQVPQHQIEEQLTAGQAIYIDPTGAIRPIHSETQDQPTWLTGRSRFQDQSVEVILAELARQYAVDIQAGDLNMSVRLSTSFPHDNLDLALKAVLGPMGWEYNIVDQVVYIEAK